MITKISVKTNTNAELFSVKLQIVQKYAAVAADSHKSGHKSLHDLKNTNDMGALKTTWTIKGEGGVIEMSTLLNKSY